MTEPQLQTSVEEAARLCGWLVYHTHDSRKSEPGFPDLVCVRAGRLFYAELKRDGKSPEPEQRKWIAELKRAGCRVYVWRPADWMDGTIEKVLNAPLGSELLSPRELTESPE